MSEQNIADLKANATDIPYAVEGGNIYFDTATGTVTDADKTVTFVNIPEKINGVDVIK